MRNKECAEIQELLNSINLYKKEYKKIFVEANFIWEKKNNTSFISILNFLIIKKKLEKANRLVNLIVNY